VSKRIIEHYHLAFIFENNTASAHENEILSAMSMLDSLMDGDIPTIPAQADLPTDPEGALIVIDGLVELAGPVARERDRESRGPQ
jgi:hypothetical protein